MGCCVSIHCEIDVLLWVGVRGGDTMAISEEFCSLDMMMYAVRNHMMIY